MLKQIPILLIYFRLIIGIVILTFALLNPTQSIAWIVGLTLIGFLSDIIDGIVARKLGVSTIGLRKLDSIIDRIFWMMVLASCYILYPSFMQTKWMLIARLLTLELTIFGFSLIKFGKIPSPHNFLSKLWGVAIVLTLLEIIISGSSDLLFNIMILLGVISRFDSLMIHVLLKKWDHDIPSMYHAYQQRLGKTIKRNDLLNG